jgi:hypothetical protein
MSELLVKKIMKEFEEVDKVENEKKNEEEAKNLKRKKKENKIKKSAKEKQKERYAKILKENRDKFLLRKEKAIPGYRKRVIKKHELAAITNPKSKPKRTKKYLLGKRAHLFLCIIIQSNIIT